MWHVRLVGVCNSLQLVPECINIYIRQLLIFFLGIKEVVIVMYRSIEHFRKDHLYLLLLCRF